MEISRKNKPLVGIIMGSDSDLKVMIQASEFLEKITFHMKWKCVQLTGPRI